MNIGFPTERDKILVNELLNAIDNGDINQATNSEFKYEHLRALLRYTYLLEDGRNFYIKIKQFLEGVARQKICKKEKVKVAFIVSGISVWGNDELYYLLEKSDLFEPYVYVFLHDIGQSVKMMVEEYDEHIRFFRSKGMRVVETLDRENGIICSWEDIGEFPDVCIWTTPWMYAHVLEQSFIQYPLSTLHTYIPYGFMLAENEKENYVQMQYNYEFHNLVCMIFEETQLAVEMAKKYAFIGDTNTIFTGLPKMDVYYTEVEDDPWKDLIQKCGNKDAKRIIYAPHHSMHEGGSMMWSTFQANYRTILELARKKSDTTVWLFKPHPALKFKCLYVGLFKDEEEWDAYVQEWEDLKNGMVYQGSEYADYFRCSDALILDSSSFIAEYLFVNKPALFLTRKEQRFNDTGNCLVSLLYKAAGKQSSDIEKFVDEVVLSGKDEKKEERMYAFTKYLDSRCIIEQGTNASMNIFHLLCAYLDKEV